MLKQIVNTVQDQLRGQLVDKIGLSRKQAKKSIEIAGESAVSVIQEEAAKGKTESLMDLFSRGDNISMDNPTVEKIKTLFLTKLSSSLNITGAKATRTSNTVLPVMIKEIGHSLKASNLSDFTTQLSLFKSSGGLKEAFGARLGKFFKRK